MLLLTVVSPQAGLLGDRARHLFGPAGGVIGRSAACDWVLPDERRHLSGRHARIAHNGLGFLVTDTSTNGVFLNQNVVPVGRDQSALLGHGDRLHLADYVIEATITDQPDLALPTSEAVSPPRESAAPGPMTVATEGGPGQPQAFWAALGIPAAHVPQDIQDQLWRILGTALREAGSLLTGRQAMRPQDESSAERAEVAVGDIDRTIRSLVQRDFAGAGAPSRVDVIQAAP